MLIIKRKRIRSLAPYLEIIPKGSRVIFGISNIQRFQSKLTQSGFSKNFESGESILPPSTFGLASRANAELRIKKHLDKPKEFTSRNCKQLRRQNGRFIETKSFDRHYLRRQRTEIIFA